MPKPGQAISVSPQTLINITSHNAHIKASHDPPCNCICFATKTPTSPKFQDTHSKAQVQRLKNGHMTHCYARFKLVAEGIPGSLSWLDPLVGISSGNILCKWSWPFLVFMCLVLVVYVCVFMCKCGWAHATYACGGQRDNLWLRVSVFPLVWACKVSCSHLWNLSWNLSL